MNVNDLATFLQENARRIQALTIGVGAEQARWSPDAASWSILEVVNHLYDEEREDFRVRLDYFWNRPGEPLPPIDPAGWVTARNYNARDWPASLANFLAEREKSLVWLRGLEAPDWKVTYPMPWGPMKAGEMMAAWVAHDLHHLRQLVELHYAWVEHTVAPYSTRYAGEW
jgi:hypothetical protein